MNSKKTRTIKHPGLVADAVRLGVTYAHLFKVLEGQRKGKSLIKRYVALKRSQGIEPDIKPHTPMPTDPTPESKPRHGDDPRRLKLEDVGPIHKALALNVLIRVRQATLVENVCCVPDIQRDGLMNIPRNELTSLALIGAAALNIDFKQLTPAMLFSSDGTGK